MISFTVLESSNGLLTKRFRIGADGRLEKATAAQLFNGSAKRHSIASPAEFAAFLSTLKPNQALAFGVTERDAPIVTQDDLSKHPGSIARDRRHFRFTQGPAVWFLDYDRQPGAAAMTPSQVRDKLIEACPALASAPMVATASASSYIYHGEKQLLGAGGVHFYVFVQNGADIPRAGKALGEHLWRIGTGRYIVGTAGQLLDRSLLDSSVYQPERLSFDAGAICAEPLTQRRPEPELWNAPETFGGAEEWDGKLFDTRLIAEPSAEELEIIRQKRREARALVAPMQEAKRDSYVFDRTEELISKGVDADTAKRTAEYATDSQVLLADFRLQLPDGKEITVAEVLENPSKYHAARFRDPLEPEYREDYRIAHANLFGGGRPYIFSHAHGGRRFELYPQTRVLKLERGERPRIQDKCLEVMRLLGNVYDQPVGGSQHRLVYAHNGSIVPVSEAWLQTYLGRLFKFERYDKRTKVSEPADVPLDIVKGIAADTTSRQLPILEAVVTDPVMREDGSLLKTAGYSERDRLLCEYVDLLQPHIPETPTDEQLHAAFATLWRPFDLFPFVDDTMRGAMVAALLTATVRATIPTSPAFMFEAPSAGSGKSLLAKCVAALATARRGIPESPPTSDEEQQKRLFASLRAGARVIFWDNVVEAVKGTAALCSFVTAARYSSRVLGVSENQEVVNRALLLMTANNPRIEGDACRRVIRVRIDARMEHPSLRAFDIEPESFVLDHRSQLWAAALTLLRGFQSRGAPKQTKDTAGSFETWDAMVRQCVIWLDAQGFAGVKLGDPYRSAVENLDNDPVKDVVSDVLRRLHQLAGSQWMTPGKVLEVLMDDSEGRSALEGIDPKGNVNAIRLGFWLKRHVDEWVAGLRLATQRNAHSKGWEYRVFDRSPSMADLV